MRILGVVLILLLGTAIAVLFVVGRRTVRQAFVVDALQVICYEVGRELGEGKEPDDAEIRALIRRLGDASVINIRLGDDNEPLDWYGNRFEVVWERDGDNVTVRCLSVGADGRKGTKDDITSVYSEP